MEHCDAILHSRHSLDITSPNLISIGGFTVRDFQLNEEIKEMPHSLPAYEEDDSMVSCLEIEDGFDIRITKSGKFLIQFHVAPLFYSRIIGSRGVIRKQIEQETHTSIKIPHQGELGDVVITGETERDVMSAKNRVDIILWTARDKMPFTHFVSIPVVSDMIKHNFDVFKTTLLTGSHIRGLDPSLFQNPNKLHLTIGTLILADDIDKNDAIKALKKCKEDIINPILSSIESLQLTMRGVEIMNDDPSEVDVLYGKIIANPPKYNDYLQKIADGIVECFAQKGLLRKQYQSVKLHVTLLNSLFRKDSNKQGGSDHRQKRETFDATRILEKYKNFHFGEVNLQFLHLSIRYSVAHNSYYEALSTISFK